MRDLMEEMARERGVSKTDLMRDVLARGLRMDGSRVIAEGVGDRPTLEHVGDPNPPRSQIPSGYFPPNGDPPPETDPADETDTDPDTSGAAPPGASGEEAPEIPEEVPPEAPDVARAPAVSSPGAGPLGLQYLQTVGPPVVVNTGGGSTFRTLFTFLAAVVGGLLLVLLVVGARYSVAAPDPGQYGSGAYLMDGWTGRVWYCESARRGLPRPVCVEFVRDSVQRAPAEAVAQ